MAQNVRAIKSRISNIEDIGQITRAMNAIAMTKVARMKRRLERTRPYVESLNVVLGDVVGRLPASAEKNPLLAEAGNERVGVLVLNADRGLCGRYKGDLNRAAENALTEHGPAARLFVGGEKARLHFERRDVEAVKTYSRLYDVPTYAVASEMADELMETFLAGGIDRLDVVSMRFISDLRQNLVVETLLPASVEPVPNDVLTESSAAEMVDELLPIAVRGRLYLAILETKASEDAIRRQAMKNATDNAEDLLKALTRTYNKARQQAITREIADIIGGAEALRSR